MEFPINSSLPITGPKLNFYLAQSKKLKLFGHSSPSPALHPKILAQSYMKNPNQKTGKVNLSSNQNKSPGFENNKEVFFPNLNKNKIFISDYSHDTLYEQNYHKPQLKYHFGYHDSLDGLFSSRNQQENRKKQFLLQNLLNSQCSLLNSPVRKQKYLFMQKNYDAGPFINRDINRGRENLQFFRHHQIDSQFKTEKQNSIPIRKRISQREKFGQGMRDISNELERINYELNVSSSKLDSMLKIYQHLSKYPCSRELKRNSLNCAIMRGENMGRRISRMEQEPEFQQYHKNFTWEANK